MHNKNGLQCRPQVIDCQCPQTKPKQCPTTSHTCPTYVQRHCKVCSTQVQIIVKVNSMLFEHVFNICSKHATRVYRKSKSTQLPVLFSELVPTIPKTCRSTISTNGTRRQLSVHVGAHLYPLIFVVIRTNRYCLTIDYLTSFSSQPWFRGSVAKRNGVNHSPNTPGLRAANNLPIVRRRHVCMDMLPLHKHTPVGARGLPQHRRHVVGIGLSRVIVMNCACVCVCARA